MKIGLILTGLQRNFEPFIQNQYKLLIEKNQCDVFIFTSDFNTYRTSETKKGIYCNFYVEDKKIENDASFFQKKYQPYLKELYIDKNDVLFNDYFSKYKHIGIKGYHIGLLQMHFKINKGIELLKNYEKKHSFQYDVIIWARLDAFFLKSIDISSLSLSKNECFLSDMFYRWMADSIIITHRKNLNILFYLFKELENTVLKYKTDNIEDDIVIEHLLYKHLKKNNLSILIIKEFCFTIGNIPCSQIPYFKKKDFKKLKSLVENIVWKNKGFLLTIYRVIKKLKRLVKNIVRRNPLFFRIYRAITKLLKKIIKIGISFKNRNYGNKN